MSGANPTHGSRTSSPTALPPMPTTIHLDDNGEGPSTSSRGIKRRHDERDGHAESSGSASTRQRRHSIEILDMTGEKSAIEPPNLPLVRVLRSILRPIPCSATGVPFAWTVRWTPQALLACICSHLEFHPGDRAGEAKPSKGTCPVCRTLISRSDSGKARGLVPLVFKKNRKVEDAASTDS
ncbi:Zinc finger RING-type [Penicillium sp. DV-2018c]|nr:Zinc finger RING-type [Penicillium sp. DV-2018c]